MEEVYVGGMPFGVKFYSQGILIVGFTEVETENGIETPALDAGLQSGDIITRVNGSEVKTAGEFIGIIENAQNPLQVTYLRGGDENTVSFVPCRQDCADGGQRLQLQLHHRQRRRNWGRILLRPYLFHIVYKKP